MLKDVLGKAFVIVAVGGLLAAIAGSIAVFRSFRTMPTFPLVILVMGIIGALVFSLLFEFGTRDDMKKHFAILVISCLLMTAPGLLYVTGGIYQGYLFGDYEVMSDKSSNWLMFFLGVSGAVAFSQLYQKRPRPVYIVPIVVCCVIAIPGIAMALLSLKP